MNIFIVKIILLYSIIFSHLIYAQGLDEQTLKNVVLIEVKEGESFRPYGTGFLMWNYKNSDLPIVVTAAHLLKRSELFITLNADSSLINLANQMNISKIKGEKHSWTIDKNKLRTKVKLSEDVVKIHPKLDIGAFLIDIPRKEIKNDSGNVILKLSDVILIPQSAIRFRDDISLGDEVYFVGFPFGIGGISEQALIEPLVRSGSISWYSNSSDEFLLDSFSYGGNSGSPIYQKRILGSRIGKLEWEPAYLIGMIIGHHSLLIKDILTQPNPSELKFEKSDMELNIGLARCIWIDDIMEVVNEVSELNILPD